MAVYRTSFTIAGKVYSVETGRLAQQANASVFINLEGCTVLTTAVASNEPREGIDFFPLLCDFEEKMYAAGKFPGGFFKREGRPTEEAVLTSRRVDRPIRPLFPKDYRNDVQIITTALSSDKQNPLDVLAILGASLTLVISDIPFDKPVGAVRVGRVGDDYVVNPTSKELELSSFNLLLAGTENNINMIEFEGKEVSEEVVLEAIRFGKEVALKIIEEQKRMRAEIGLPTTAYPSYKYDRDDIKEMIRTAAFSEWAKIIPGQDSLIRNGKIEEILEDILKDLEEKGLIDRTIEETYVVDHYHYLLKQFYRNFVLSNRVRADGRRSEEIRAIKCEVGVLPRVHGSGLFTRGTSQVLSTLTLGTFSDQQKIDGLQDETFKRFTHHYNFPPFSTGEIKPLRSPGRREIGHGALAERSLLPVIPPEDAFPYTVRIVSECLSSGGSTSMASVCGSTLALMDAGVPISEPVAGIAMGLIVDEEDISNFVVLSDLEAFEDFNGEMDFKIAGTKNGITGIQLDVKIEGLTDEILEKTLYQAKEGRLKILEEMAKVIDRVRPTVSEFAPKLTTIKIPQDRIGEVIGPAGKYIRKIITDTETKIDITPEGTVFITGETLANVEQAVNSIKAIISEIEVGTLFKGKVVSITSFGAFIELVPGKEGLLHISQVAPHRIERVEEYLKIGDEVLVEVTRVEDNGKLSLTRKDIPGIKPDTGPRTRRPAEREGGGGRRFQSGPKETRPYPGGRGSGRGERGRGRH